MEFVAWLLVAIIAMGFVAGAITWQIAKARCQLAESGEMLRWPATKGFATEVVGESHYRAALLKILAGCEQREMEAVAVLIPYSSRHDSEAVRVEIKGRVVGHLSREDARIYRKRVVKQFDSVCVAAAGAVIGSTLDDGVRGPIGVRLAVALR